MLFLSYWCATSIMVSSLGEHHQCVGPVTSLSTSESSSVTVHYQDHGYVVEDHEHKEDFRLKVEKLE